MADDRTLNFSIPLPNANNSLLDDVARLRSALAAIDSALATRQAISEKGAANGYAPLDSLGKVPAANLPSYVDDVLEYENLAAFPATGESEKIYVALDTGRQYRWGGSTYTQMIASPGTTDDIVEGLTNLFFTPARARAAQNIATPSQLGLVKVGANLVIDENGLLSAPGSQSATNTFIDQYFTPTAGQMTFTVTGGYVVGQIEVFLNGVLLFADDYTATNGVHVVLAAGVATTDTLLVRKWSSFSTSLLASQAEAEAGTDPAKLMTPQRVSQAIAALSGSSGVELTGVAVDTTLTIKQAGCVAVSTTMPGILIKMPDATTIVGAGCYFLRNSGSYSFTVTDNAGNVLAELGGKKSVLLWNVGKATAAGRWAILSGGTDQVGPKAIVNTAVPSRSSIVQIDTDKAIATWIDSTNGNNLKAAVLFISGTSVQIGPVFTVNAATTVYVSSCSVGTNKAVILYSDNSSYCKAIALSVSGMTIIAGSALTVQASAVGSVSISKIGTDKAIAIFTGTGTPDYAMKACVLSVSVLTLSAGSIITVDISAQNVCSCQIAADKALVAFGAYSAIVLSASGTTLSAGAKATIASTNPGPNICLAKIGTDKAISFFNDSSASGYGSAVVLSVSGTTVSVGSKFTVNAATTSYTAIASMGTDKAVVIYQDYGSNYYANAALLSVSGTTISVGQEFNVNPATINFNSACNIGNDKAVVLYSDSGLTGYTAANVIYGGAAV